MSPDTPNALDLADDDASLAHRISRGDRLAFEVLMRRFNSRLYRLARASLRDEAEALDALQAAYLNAYRSIATFRGASTVSTWLSRLVLNECLARQRRSARRENIIPMVSAEAHMSTVADVPDTADSPEKKLGREQMRGLLERKVSELPEALRTVFVLRSVEELTVEDTAQTLSIPEATVRSRHFRARSLLRESLAREVDLAERELFEFGGARCDGVVRNVLAQLADEPADPARGYSSPACYSHEFEDEPTRHLSNLDSEHRD